MNTDTFTPALVPVAARDVLTIDGHGAPEDPSFAAAVRALFATRAALGGREDVSLEGSYSQSGDPLRFPSLATLYAFVTEQGLAPAGQHTEVYLTDPRSTTPADLRTLLQVPVR